MATNGNDPLQSLEQTLRGVVPTQTDDPLAIMPEGAKAPETYDLMKRVHDTAQSIRDLASYSNSIADDLEKITAAYVGHMQRLLGRIGK